MPEVWFLVQVIKTHIFLLMITDSLPLAARLSEICDTLLELPVFKALVLQNSLLWGPALCGISYFLTSIVLKVLWCRRVLLRRGVIL